MRAHVGTGAWSGPNERAPRTRAEIQRTFLGQSFVALRAYSDETKVGRFRGRSVYPLSLELLGLPMRCRADPANRILAALLPVVAERFTAKQRETDEYRQHRQVVTWQAVRRALRPLCTSEPLRFFITMGENQSRYYSAFE